MLKKAGLILALLLAAIWVTAALAEEEAHSYVGLKKCKMCHKKEATGDQFGVWSKGPHAGAFASLSSEAGLAKAAELGVEDPSTDSACLQCHTTGHGVAAELGGDKLLAEDGVSCEACHGAGSAYYKKKTMAAINAGEMDGASVGLTVIDEATCLQCHKAENPGHKGEFDFEKSMEKVTHLIPEATE